MSDRTRPAEAARYAVIVLTAMNLLNYIDRYVPSAVKDLIKVDLGLTDAQTSLPLTSFVWVYMLASPVFGAMADRVSRPKLIAAGVALWSLATAGAALSVDFWSFLFARALVGVGEAAYATLAPPLISDLYPPEQRNRILTRFYVAIPVGAALGFAAGGILGQHFGWRAAFLVCGLPGLLAAGLALRIPDPPRGGFDGEAPAPPPPWPEALRSLGKNRTYLVAVAGYTAVTFAAGAMADWFPAFLERHRGMDHAQAGTLVGAVTVVGGLGGTALGGWLADRLAGTTRQPFLALSAVSMVLATISTIGALLAPAGAAVIVAMGLAQFFLWFYNGPINTIIANSAGGNLRARAFALSILSIHLLGDAISPTIVGYLSDATGNLPGALVLIPVTMALGALIWGIGWRTLPEATA